MASDNLDNVDMGILYLLQQNARTNTTNEIGERVGVSSSTVSNRIKNLEDHGVITSYQPTVDYEKAGLSHHLILTGTVPLEEQAAIADEIMDASGVVRVRELFTNNENVSIELVGNSRRDIEQAIAELNGIDVDIERMEMLKRDRSQPFNHFGKEIADEE